MSDQIIIGKRDYFKRMLAFPIVALMFFAHWAIETIIVIWKLTSDD